MLKQILAISGKPGLYKLVSHGNRSLIVETIDDKKKRMPAFGTDRVVSLADISIYTDDDQEISLAQVLDSAKQCYNEAAVDLSPKKASDDDIIGFFTKVLPNYDKDRVRVSDMRKVLSWYNILVNNGLTDFVTDEDSEEDTATEEAAAE